MEAILRRSAGNGSEASTGTEESIQAGTLEICTRTRSVRRAGIDVDLAPKEYDLLLELVRNDGAVVSRVELMKNVWGHSSTIVSRTVDTHVAELRRKLEADPANPGMIVTVRKAGYRFVR